MSSAFKFDRPALDDVAEASPPPAPVEPAPVEDVWSERRGPLRPERLSPTRSRLSGRMLTRYFQAGDGLALFAAAYLARAIEEAPRVSPQFGAAGLAVFVSLQVFDTYRLGRSEDLAQHLTRVTMAVALGLAVWFAVTAPFIPVATLVQEVGVWTPLALACVAVAHAVWWANVRRWRTNGRLTPNIVIVGATGAAERLVGAMLRTREAHVLGIFDDRAARAPKRVRDVPVLGDTEALLAHRIMPFVDRVVITVPSGARDRVRALLNRLEVLPNEITLLLDRDGAADEAIAIGRIADLPLTRISGTQVNHGKAAAKRMQDLVIGTIALIVFGPLMMFVAAAVRLDSPGPALFRQRRHGFNNEEIVVWKFRSMRVESADAKAARQISVGDDRVTRVGRFIRKTSLDELPQLFNVLKGEMSLVGPRPHAIGMKTGDVESHRLVAEYAHRHRMKPGMTGWAAIHGSRGAIDTPDLVKQRVSLDVEYIERQSFWLDLYVMAMTVPCLLGDSETVR